MNYLPGTQDEAFDRLERLLVSMRVGDELFVPDVVRLTGLSEEVCSKMLTGLTRAGLMSCKSERLFVRRPLDLQLT
jgi:hypothetical protein